MMNHIKYHAPMFWFMLTVKGRRTGENENVDNHMHIHYQRVFTKKKQTNKQNKKQKQKKTGSDNNFISLAPNYVWPFSLDLCFFPFTAPMHAKNRNAVR